MVRLLHVSDVHFGCENKAAVAAVADLVRSEPFDVVIQSGDITQVGAEAEFRAGAAWLRTLDRPVVCTPGNHDTPEFGVLTRFFDPWRLYRHHIDPIGPRAFRGPGVCVETMNTARGVQARINWSKGAAREDQAHGLCERLSHAPVGALKVAVCHHPLLEITGGPMTGRVWGGERAARIVACGGADLVLTGHIHMPFAHPLPFGDHRTYAVGASTLSHRERGSAPGFNVIEADEAQIRITAMGWTGSRFDAQRSWGFDRRVGGAGCDLRAESQASGGLETPAG
jgi:3',5'-cyclic AMP phosphodiesterase CpdA